MEKKLVELLNISPDYVNIAYREKFSRYKREKYSDKGIPLEWIMINDCFGCKQSYSQKQKKDIYKRCIKENLPWQEIPEI